MATRMLVRLATLVALGSPTLGPLLAQQPAPRWTLAAQPTLTLGLDDSKPEAILQKVVGATRLPDGGILVGDMGDFALKRFSATGQLERAFGRQGSGPGEIRYLARLFRCGDSVYTYDVGEGSRTSVFAIDGRYVRTFRFRTPPNERAPYTSACNAAGDFVHLGWGLATAIKPGVHRPTVLVWTSRGDSLAGRVVDSVPGSERWGIGVDGQLRGSRPLPLGKQTVIGIGRSRVYIGSADRFELRVYDLAGRPLDALQRPEPPVPLSRTDIREAIDQEVAESGGARQLAIAAAYADMTFPPTLPPYTKLVIDADDDAWVRAFPRRGDSVAQWSVFSATGALVAQVAIPTYLEVYEIGRDYVLGRYLDPADAIPQVRLYRLTRDQARR